MDRAVRAVERAGGISRTSDLRAMGIRRRDLSAAVQCGRLRRPRVGVYALPSVTDAVAEALSHCGAIACVTAARSHGMWTLDDGADESVHTWVDPRHRAVRVAIEPDPDEGACCVFHREIPTDEPQLGRVGLLHCLTQILRCRGDEAFFAALESALRLQLVDDDNRAALREAVPVSKRWLVDFARSDAESGLESLLRLRLHHHGLTLASQVQIPGVGRVDFVVGDCLILEADGETHENSRHADRERDAAAAALGFVTLRFDYALIVHDWPLVEAAILSAISRNLHRSHAGLTW